VPGSKSPPSNLSSTV